MRGIARIVASALLVGLVWGGEVLADGKAFMRSGDSASYLPVGQNRQQAAIDHRDGRQKMVIAINISPEDDGQALWIFPMPGTPDQTELDLVDAFPHFRGRDPRRWARETLGEFLLWARRTQIWPLLAEIRLYFHERTLGTPGAPFPGVAVHAHVEKWGIHAEAVTAPSVEALASYLRGKGAELASEELAAFEDYLSDDYVLVVAWIASREEVERQFPTDGIEAAWGEGRWPCLYVEFPTERGFYPLRPTSTYGDVYMAIDLWVTGWVVAGTRRFFPQHYLAYRPPDNAPHGFARGLPSADIPYTHLWFRGSAEQLDDDLSFIPVRAPGMAYARAVEYLERTDLIVPLWIVFVGMVSYLSAGITGLLLCRRWRGYATLGLWNVLTLVGFYIACRAIGGERGESVRRYIGPWLVLRFCEGRTIKLGLRFWHVFTVIYVLFTVLSGGLLLSPL